MSINNHIKEYLNYYCDLSKAPEFAVLLKGQWGSGKTWFIEKYQKETATSQKRYLYISLYGVTSFSEIEDLFFQQLHPILSSPGMAITGKIAKGILKGSLKIDLDRDAKDDGTWSPQINDINLPKYLKNTDKHILIFDDLERCNISIESLLGYINYFVEHKRLKVILIANEDELLNNSADMREKYARIKEKLIGRILCLSPELHHALEDFTENSENQRLKTFLLENRQLIEDLYKRADYENLRNLRKVILDFERIYNNLPQKAKDSDELLKDTLKYLIIFSIEIDRGKMRSGEISYLKNEYIGLGGITISIPLNGQKKNEAMEKETKEDENIQEIVRRYRSYLPQLIFPSSSWWYMFFDKGISDKQELEQSISTSLYFLNEETPDWLKLWHFYQIEDDREFEETLNRAESAYLSREYREFSIFKHVTGILFKLSDIGLYSKKKTEILEDAKSYVDHLIKLRQIDISHSSFINSYRNVYTSDYWENLVFHGYELDEFKEFCDYVDKARSSARINSLPSVATSLLEVMESDPNKFYDMICCDHDYSATREIVDRYHQDPILQYIELTDFLNRLKNMKSADRKRVFWAIGKRYESDVQKLIEELDWLKKLKEMLLKESHRKEGKLSGYQLKVLVETYLDKSIIKLEPQTNSEGHEQNLMHDN
jgi:hypothetical protein